MRLLAWNIRQGGGQRVPAILTEVSKHGPDILVLTEARGTAPTMKLRAGLESQGYTHQHVPTGPTTANSVLVAAKSRLRPHATSLTGGRGQRVACCAVGTLNVIGAYFPSVPPHILRFYNSIAPLTRKWSSRPTVLVGDLNSGLNGVDTEASRFSAAPGMQRLLNEGWTDAWRHVHGDRREYSWYSDYGNGYRIDHALLSPSALPLLRHAEYDHGPRLAGTSDHSVLLVELRQ